MIALLKLLTYSPTAANALAAVLMGRPDLIDDLNDITYRETRNGETSPYGPHECDAWISPHEWSGQVSWGHLDPTCQPRNVPGGWATRGAHGLSAGTHWYLMWRCYDPRLFDIPLVSAWVAVRKYERECEPKRRHTIRGWCKVESTSWHNNFLRRET